MSLCEATPAASGQCARKSVREAVQRVRRASASVVRGKRGAAERRSEGAAA